MRRIIMAAALVAATAGCGGLTEPQSQARLHGSWREVPEPSVNPGTRQSTMTFGADGSYISEFRAFGTYPGQPAADLSGYMIATGTYEIVEGSIRVRLQRRRSWDFFYGAGSPEQVEEFAPAEQEYDIGRFGFIRNMLILRGIGYPADAPVEWTAMFVRLN